MSVSSSFHELFLLGADALVAAGTEYDETHQAAGFSQSQWNTLTQKERWSPADADQVKALISHAVSCHMKAAGLPPTPLPAPFVAATIVKFVAPCNRFTAAYNAPESFDPMAASGLVGEPVDIIATRNQIYSLVQIISSEDYNILTNVKVDEVVERALQERGL